MQNVLSRIPARAATPLQAEPAVLSIAAAARQSPDSVFLQLSIALREQDAAIAALFVYGDVAAKEVTTAAMRRHLGPVDWPVLWVEGRSCNGALIAGAQAFLLRGNDFERLLVKGRVVGTMFSDGGARHCLLAGIGPDSARGPREQQVRESFDNLQAALEVGGFDFGDIARTWFYNDQLLDWYDVFNRVRTSFYSQCPFRSGAVPASTGVDGRNPFGAALAMAAWAVRPLGDEAKVSEVMSPLQCPAPAYGSTFSRAMEIQSAGIRRLLISGTASIALEGETLWRGDVVRQIATTMDVVGAILASRGMQFDNVARAVAYVKYPLDAAAFERWQQDHHVNLPVVYVHCDICRDDLLFELELDATTSV